ARAVERALLVESERIARVRAARLQRLTEELAGAETQESVARRAVQVRADIIEASAGALYLVAADEGARVRVATHGPFQGDDGAEAVPLGAAHGIAAAVRSKHAQYLEGDAAAGAPARAHLPLLHDGKALGAIAVRFDEPRRFP